MAEGKKSGLERRIEELKKSAPYLTNHEEWDIYVEDMRWFYSERENLKKDYDGQWIAVYKKGVVVNNRNFNLFLGIIDRKYRGSLLYMDSIGIEREDMWIDTPWIELVARRSPRGGRMIPHQEK